MSSPSFIGRKAQLATLHEALAATLGGQTLIAVIAGEAGIGKTRLVREFLDDVPRDVIVAAGQSVDLDADAPPYAPVIGLLRTLFTTIGSDEFLDAAGRAREALALLMPDLEGPRTAPNVRGSAEWLYDSIAVLLENLARRAPLVLVIEDLHWADEATLGLLEFLARMLDQAPILFVLTYRTDDRSRGHRLRSWLPELRRSRRVAWLELDRLSRAEVRQLAGALRHSALESRELDLLYERSDGVPFLVEELVGVDDLVGVDPFPSSLRDVLLVRYDTLGEAAQRLVRLLAAGGLRVEHELLAAVYDGEPDQLDRAAHEAVAASVIVADDTAYRFRHALVRDAVHEELLPGERSRFHSQYATALEATRGTDAVIATAVSYHWMAAHDVRAAFSSSIFAMRQAGTAYAPTAAARMGERALELWPCVADAAELAGCTHDELLVETSHALCDAGDSERAIALIDDAIAEVPDDAPELLAERLRDKATYHANTGREGSIELLRRALAVLAGRPASPLRATVLGELAARLMLQAHLDDAAEVADAAFAEAETVHSRAHMSVARNIHGATLVCAGRIEEGLAEFGQAGELARGDDASRLRYWVNLSDAMNLLGRFDDAVRLAREGLDRARQRGVERTKGAILLSNLIEPMFALGHWTQAGELLDRALELDPPAGFRAHLQRLKLWSTLWGGDPVEAARMLRTWSPSLRIPAQNEAQVRLGLARVAGEIALENGDLADAWQRVRGVLDPEHRAFAAYDLPLLVVAARVLAAIVTTGIDEPAVRDAHGAAQQLRALLVRHAEWPGYAALAAIIDAELGGSPHAGSDAGLWRLALDAAGAPTTPAHLRPWVRVRLAEALASAADRPAARREAAVAGAEAAALGAGLVVARAAALERRMGVRAANAPAGDAPAVLTEHERQVLELVAQGLSNRQIAEALFISVKTASVHVSAILRKLGASSRTEAAHVARQSA